jgi:anti-sigma regulatory factor (Ser/Thr protein kinase)
VQSHFGIDAPSLGVRLQARPESAFLLRQRLSLWLDELGAGSDDVFAVSLAVTEAFANAVEHPHAPTRSVVEVDGSLVDHTVTVTVRDSGSWGAERKRVEGGHGLRLMRHFMDSVDIKTRSSGTSITLRRHLQDVAARAPRDGVSASRH